MTTLIILDLNSLHGTISQVLTFPTQEEALKYTNTHAKEIEHTCIMFEGDYKPKDIDEVIDGQILKGWAYKHSNGGFSNLGSSLVHEVIPKRRIVDLILSQNILELCNSIIEEHNRKDMLRSYNIEPRNKILLIGPPGNGKTSLAEGIAEALMVPLLVVRYESIIGSSLGETAIRINRLFKFASTRQCVLFFDEFETLGKERGDIHETGEIKRVVSSLLLKIDDLPSHVIAIGATNHPELLDKAVWRRFQVRVKLTAPAKPELVKWWKAFEDKMKFSSKVHEEKFFQIFSKCSFAEIEEFGNTVYRYSILSQQEYKITEILDRVLIQWENMFEAK